MGNSAEPRDFAAQESNSGELEIKTTNRHASECMAKAISLHQAGKLEEAIVHYRQALSIRPDFIGAYFNLGLVFEKQEKLDSAVANYRRVLTLSPDNADACFNLGNVLKKQGKLKEAINYYRNALALNPNDVEACFNMGNALQDNGELEAAAQSYRQAISLRPGYSEAHNNLGNTLQKQGRLIEAISSHLEAIACNANNAEAYNSMGNAFREMGRTGEAFSSYQKAISIKPDYAQAHGNLGNLRYLTGKLDEAIISYRKSLELKPDFAEAYNNLGNAFHSQGKLEEAIASFRKALEIKPDFAEACIGLGNVLLDQGKLDEAVKSCYKALSIKPNYVLAFDNLLMAMTYHPGYLPADYLAEVRRYGARVGAQAKPYTRWPVLSADQNERPLRIGLVSGDLRAHPVGFFLQGIVDSLNPARVELVAYMTNLQEDSITTHIRPLFAAWNSLIGMSEEDAARKIHDDGIQILVDLSGHTAHNRLPVFAWKPAPVQVSWLGYWASTGVPGMDYLLADKVSVPEKNQGHFTETIWYLPDTRLCFTPPADSTNIPPSPLPRMRNGYITFGCFQKLGKINEGVLALWGRIFHALPDARLRLQNRQMNCPVARKQIRDQLANFGIAPERVSIAGEVPREDYLAAHADVDIILDTFPFPGGTTTCEALWMGVPTLTLAGDTLLGRQGASMLACAGLANWIASDENDYVDKAISHATDVDRLSQLRIGLRDKVKGSPLFDGCRFAQNLENALHEMWQNRKLLELERE